MAEVVLVTGVSRYLGGRFARLLTAQPGIKRVIGVDVIPPLRDIGNAEFVRADIRNPMIAKIITQAVVDTVVHMNVIATPVSAGGRVSQKEINVIGHAAPGGLPEGPLHPPLRGQVLGRRLWFLTSGPGDVYGGHGAKSVATGGFWQGLG